MAAHSADVLHDLNPQQQRVALHPDGPMLVLAGPGTGKTRVIASRIIYRICSGSVAADRILGITFTNSAAAEMKARVAGVLGEGPTTTRFGTFHWLCHAILRRHGHRSGLRRSFGLLGPRQALQVLRRAGDALPALDSRALPQLAAAISLEKNGASCDSAARRHGVDPAAVTQLAEVYERELRAIDALDLDDLLGLAVRLLREHDDVREVCRGRYDEILVDEYQDVNPIQHELVRLIMPSTHTVVAVGDEDQAIYAWREANAQSMLRFTSDFAGAETMRLEQTYRSTKHIVRCARSLISYNRRRLDKRLRTIRPAGERPLCFVARDEVEEADWIASEVERRAARENRSWRDFAVLFRTNAQSRAIEDAFLRRGIPFHMKSGRRFYERSEVRTIVAHLRLALDRDDEDALATLLEGVSGIGRVRLSDLRRTAQHQQASLRELLLQANGQTVLPDSVQLGLHQLQSRLDSLWSCRELALPELVDRTIATTRAESAHQDLADALDAVDNLDELRSIAQEFAARKGTLRHFVERLRLTDASQAEMSGVSCLTLHAAKGLEFPIVFIPGLEEGMLPHRRSLDSDDDVEEERRLCYVGLTRARDLLYLSYTHSRLLAGRAIANQPSRFLREIGRAHFELRFGSGRAHPLRTTEEPSHVKAG